MKTTAVTPADLTSSIMALAPLAHGTDGALAEVENARLIFWLTQAGVTTLLYGGVANLFNITRRDFAALLEMLARLAPLDCWVIPSIGADYGKAMDQIEILRDHDFPTAMILPFAPVTQAGVATGLRRLADAYRRPLMLFLKSADYITPEDAAALLGDGVLCCLEYGLAPPDLAKDPYLEMLLAATGSVERIVDGSGERTVVARNAAYGITGFTSGSGIIAPHIATSLLAALKQRDIAQASKLREQFLPLETLRQRHGPIPVLHDAVGLAGIAATGPLAPFFSNIADPDTLDEIAATALALKTNDLAFAG
jgi:dihydrodipicolinate synthase/N-acetylneuraminate lyase